MAFGFDVLSERARRWGLCFLLAVVGGLAYRSTLTDKFVYDDDSFVVLNPSVRSLRSPARFFADPLTLAQDPQLARDNYRPLTTISFALNYQLGGLNPYGYHLANLLLHFLNAALVFWLAWRLSGRRFWFAYLTAAIFLLHPLQTESVTWVSQRSGLLGLFFMLLAWHAYLEERPVLSLGMFGLSLLSKEAGVMLPFLLVLQDLMLTPRQTKTWREWTRSIWRYAPYFGEVAILALAKRLLVGRISQTHYWGGDFLSTFYTMLKGFAVYLKLLVLPWPLSIEYLFPVSHSLFEPAVLGSAFLIAGLVAVAWRWRARRPLAAFGILFFFVALGPVSNIIPIRTIINERFSYLPLIGFALSAADVACGWLGERTFDQDMESRPSID